MSNKRTTGFKVVFLGGSGVGKSSLILRFVRGYFSERIDMTIGASFLTKDVELRLDIVKLDIWDTAGQEMYNALAPMYYRGSDAAFVVFDITDPASFEQAKAWIKELKLHVGSDLVITLVGNKDDMAAKRMVNREEANEYAYQNRALYFEASAKTGSHVDQMFREVADKLIRRPAKIPGRAPLVIKDCEPEERKICC